MALSYNPWTAETTTTFVQLWETGDSYSKIAKQMRMTRNALIGKALRMGLKRGKGKRSEPEAKEPKAKAKTNGHAPQIPSGPARKIEASSCTLFALQYFNCRFPLWSDDGSENLDQKFYCGAPRDLPGPYCAKHARIASRPAPPVRV